MATSRYTANPRARTHRGNDNCAAAFNVVNVISHDIPDNTKMGVAAANGSQATASGAKPYDGGRPREQHVVGHSLA